jgi:N-acyl homoserine lactone hydrolase
MANHIIHPIPLFQFEAEKSIMTFGRNFGRQVTSVSYVWYIEGADDRILVDAGGDIDYVSRSMGRIPVKEIQSLEAGLRKFGTGVDDIDVVILTHLHYDHVQLASRFTKARFLIQRNELQFAYSQHPMVRMLGCIREFYDKLDFNIVDGDARVCDGVSVINTPGHSPGGQSVIVQTTKGLAIISGLCTIRENFEPPPSIVSVVPVIPTGIYSDICNNYDSLIKIKEMADIIVPLHDPECLDRSSIP